MKKLKPKSLKRANIAAKKLKHESLKKEPTSSKFFSTGAILAVFCPYCGQRGVTFNKEKEVWKCFYCGANSANLTDV